MKKATRLIIEENDNIIFIKRTKKENGKVNIFYVLPGGILDENETWEEAGIREAKEELDVDVLIEDFFLEEYTEDLDKLERYYFAKVTKGKIQEGCGEEFRNMSINSKYGLYEVVRLSKKEMFAYNILPTYIKDKLIATYI